MSPATLAAVSAGAAVWFITGRGAAAAARLRRLSPQPMRHTVIRLPVPSPQRAAVVAGAVVGAAAGVIVGVAAVAPAGIAAAEAARRVLCARRERAAEAVRRDVAGWCVAAATELRIGRTPVDALAAAVEQCGSALAPVVAPVVAVGRLGGDVVAALVAAAAHPGAEALRYVGACWAVAGDTGAGLATALQKLSGGLQARERLRAEVESQLASARATARLLAVLPVFGLLLGQAVGARPTYFLLHTAIGAVCIASTVVLNVLGLVWTDRIAARVAL